MIVLSVVLIAVALLLALLVAVLLPRGRAVPAGPRTVAELVRQRAAAAPPAPVGVDAVEGAEPAGTAAAAGPDAAEPVEVPAAEPAARPDLAAAGEAPSGGVEPLGDDVPWRRAASMASAPADPVSVDPVPAARLSPSRALRRRPSRPRAVEPAVAVIEEPEAEEELVPAPPAERAPLTVVPDLEEPAAKDAAAEPPPAQQGGDPTTAGGHPTERVDADRAPDAPEPPVQVETSSAPPAERDVLVDAPPTRADAAAAEGATTPVAEAPAATGPAQLAAVVPAVVEPVVAEPVVAEPVVAEPVVVEPVVAGPVVVEPVVVEPVVVEPAGPDPTGRLRPARDLDRLAAEQAAADLALSRTFGASDLARRPDRAPVVALEGVAGRVAEPVTGPGQPVRVRVVHRDGTPVDGVGTALIDDRGHECITARTGADGHAELHTPHPGRYVLVATAPDHQPGAVALGVGAAPLDVEVLLARSAALTGLVTGEDGPIGGARITLVQDGELVDGADTEAEGRYRVPDLAAGEYAVSVAAAGCEPHVALVTVPDETELAHDVELAPAGLRAG